MTLRFWSLFPLIVSFQVSSYQRNENKIFINLNQSLIEVDVDLIYEIEFSSNEAVKWIIPKNTYQRSYIILTNNTLFIKVNNSLEDVYGNLSVCRKLNTSESMMEIYDIPKCCPCCAWYNKKLCDYFYKKIDNCTTIVLYSRTILKVTYYMVYENNMLQLPCRMESSNFKDNLEIKEYFGDTQYLNYQKGELKYKSANFDYNPSSGLCFNTSVLVNVRETFLCKYSNRSVTIWLYKLDLSTDSIHSSLEVLDDIDKNVILNYTIIKLLLNTTLKIKCKSQYSFHRQQTVMMCVKFEILSDNPSDFNCTNFKGMLNKDLIINATEIKNGSKLICSTISPSREISESIEVTLYKYQEEVLKITNFESLNNKVLSIHNNNTILDIIILFYLIPFNSHVNCTSVRNTGVNIIAVCSVTISEQCICRINTQQIIQRKLKANLTLSIFNNRFKESLSVILMPIYIEKPKISGLTTKYEDKKRIFCDVEASKPFNIAWSIEFNKEEPFIHSSASQFLTLPLNSTNYVCVQCTVVNDAGSKDSEKECKTILDVEINDNKTVQIFVINSTIWTDRIQLVKEMSFLDSKTIEIVDLNSVFIMCASRYNNDTLELYSTPSAILSKHIEEIRTEYTVRNIQKLDLTLLGSFNTSVRFFCRQRHHNDSTGIVTILRSFTPLIHLFEGHKPKFLIGQNVHLTVGVKSFPPAEVKLFKVGYNKSYYFGHVKDTKFQITTMTINSTYCKISVMLFNVSISDSGKYSIIASNIRGVSSFIFQLDHWSTTSLNSKVYAILGSCIAAVVMCLIGVICFCKRFGYVVPIIQIQNNMYTSLDCDLVQITSAIWPDPLERAKWLIRPSSNIKVKKRIGGGNYGVIYAGMLQNSDSSSEQLVALKCPILSRSTSGGQSQFCQISFDCFMNEIKILSLLTNCSNIITMYGCTVFRDWINEKCEFKEPTTMIVLEFCSNFSLREFLNKNAPSFAPYTRFRNFTLPKGYAGMTMDEGVTLLDLKRISLGIATGLEYLSELNIIHRDLASRNILIDERKNPKICDFGLAIELENEYSLSKSYQILTHNKALPYKILAPEALECQKFYLQSDVWSFGLLMWGIFNLEKEELFPDINTPSELLRYINNKLTNEDRSNFLKIPQYANESTWELIKTCWSLSPFDRPSVHSVRSKLMEIVRSSPVEVIRVNSCNSETYDSNCRNSIGSSKFPSTCTSVISVNFQTSPTDSVQNHSLEPFYCEFRNEESTNETVL